MQLAGIDPNALAQAIQHVPGLTVSPEYQSSSSQQQIQGAKENLLSALTGLVTQNQNSQSSNQSQGALDLGLSGLGALGDVDPGALAAALGGVLGGGTGVGGVGKDGTGREKRSREEEEEEEERKVREEWNDEVLEIGVRWENGDVNR
jgi:hypothetical protein